MTDLKRHFARKLSLHLTITVQISFVPVDDSGASG